MKQLASLILMYLITSLSLVAAPVNAIMGDESFRYFFGKEPLASASETLRISTHLRYVEWILRRAPTSRLTEAQKRSRSHMIHLLHRYRLQENFPSNYDFPGQRRPCFIDRYQNICAVGYLIEQTAGRALAEKINLRYQYDYIADMNHMPELDRWISESGITVIECAMIQPQYAHSNDGRVQVPESTISREEFVEKLRQEIALPDSLFADGPITLGVNFTITASGMVSQVKLSRRFPKEIHRGIVKAVKKLRFKPAYKMNYIEEENRYENEDIATDESIYLVFYNDPTQEGYIRNRKELTVPGYESYFGEKVICNLIEVYPKAQGHDSLNIKGIITDLPVHYYTYLIKMRIYAKGEEGYELLDEVPLQKNHFELTLPNGHHSDFKIELVNVRNEVDYAMEDLQPGSQTLLITLFDSENNQVICGGGCFESYPDTKKVWYYPMTVQIDKILIDDEQMLSDR